MDEHIVKIYLPVLWHGMPNTKFARPIQCNKMTANEEECINKGSKVKCSCSQFHQSSLQI